MQIKRIKQVYFIFILIGTVLFSTMTYLYYIINEKSSKMLNHRTTVVKNLSYIKFHVSETHLWLMEYISGDDIERNKIFENLQSIDNKLNFLISFEKNKIKVTQSKFRDSEKIYQDYLKLSKEYHKLSVLAKEQLENKHQAGSSFDKVFDKQYYKFLGDITKLEHYLDETFINVNNDFSNMKNNVYIIIFILCFFGLLISYVVMKAEISKIKKLQEKEDAIKIQSQNKIDAISTMLSNIAHQWRQPLNAISISMSALLLKLNMEDKIDKDDAIKQIEFTINKTQYLSNIINDFKSFYSDEELLNMQEFNIKETINDTIISLEDSLQKEGITIVSNLEDFIINNNETQLKQVFFNILSNSIEALHEKNDKYIFIDSKMDEKKHLKIIIKDSAQGVEEEYIEKIYEPYFTTKHQSQGTGLGLHFVYEVITKYFNGHIQSNNSDFLYKSKQLKGLETTLHFKN